MEDYSFLENVKKKEPVSMSPNYDYVVGWNEAVDFIMDVLADREALTCSIGPQLPETPKPDMSLVKTIYEDEDEGCYEYRGVKIYWNVMGEGEYTIGEGWYAYLEDACKEVERTIIRGSYKPQDKENEK